MEIGLFSLLPVSPIVNLPFPSLRSGSRGALLLSVPGRAEEVSVFCYPSRFVCCPSSVPRQILKITPGEQRWGAGWTGRAR